MPIRAHDVLVIGGGLAGPRAALAAGPGVDVAVVSKVYPTQSHSGAAQGGLNAAIDPRHQWEDHWFDTVKGSDYLGDQDAIELTTRAAPSTPAALPSAPAALPSAPTSPAPSKLGVRSFF